MVAGGRAVQHGRRQGGGEVASGQQDRPAARGGPRDRRGVGPRPRHAVHGGLRQDQGGHRAGFQRGGAEGAGEPHPAEQHSAGQAGQ